MRQAIRIAYSICLSVALTAVPLSAVADDWVDVDKDTFVSISGDMVSISSLGNFFYFDEVFRSALNGDPVRICFGKDNGAGIASNCLGFSAPKIEMLNHGKNRTLSFDVSELSSFIGLFEDNLRRGQTLKVSIDDGRIFAAYELNGAYKLDENSLAILQLN